MEDRMRKPRGVTSWLNVARAKRMVLEEVPMAKYNKFTVLHAFNSYGCFVVLDRVTNKVAAVFQHGKNDRVSARELAMGLRDQFNQGQELGELRLTPYVREIRGNLFQISLDIRQKV
jgi:hypothetical protein